MLIRVASYYGKNELESFFGTSLEDADLPAPHYNLGPGDELPALSVSQNGDHIHLSKYIWGGESGSKADAMTDIQKVKEQLSEGHLIPCIVPVSGFYMWKNDDLKDQPFFVRMMNLPFMPAAGVLRSGVLQMIAAKSNTLVEPMSAVMPLVLNSQQAQNWIQKTTDITELSEQAYKSFFITDFTVLKVSKKVSDPAANEPSLIQPLPK